MDFECRNHTGISTNKVSFRAVPQMKIQPITTIAIGVLMASLFAVPSTVWAGLTDCNENGIPDGDELTGNDCNNNLVLDVCENDVFGPITTISYTTPGWNESFPESLQLDGDELLVGSSVARNPAGNFVGSVDYFRLVNEEWVHVQTVLGPDLSGATTRFGLDLARSGDWLIVSAHRYPVANGPRGVVYVYRLDHLQGLWVEHSIIPNEEIGSIFEFGRIVRFDGIRLIVANGLGTSIFTPFAIRCFEHDGGNWVPTQTLTSNDLLVPLLGNISNDMLVSIERTPSQTTTGEQSPWSLIFRRYNGRGWAVVDREGILPIPSTNISFKNLISNDARVAYTYGTPDFRSLRIFDRIGQQWQSADIVLDGDQSFSDLGFYLATDEGRLYVSGTSSGAGHIVEIVGTPGFPSLVSQISFDGPTGPFDISKNAIVVVDEAQGSSVRYAQRFGDCDFDGVLNSCEIIAGEVDIDGDLLPDACEVDCNQDGVPDDEQIAAHDCDANGILDECDVNPIDPDGDGIISEDCNGNLQPDHCEADCNQNGIVDACDINLLDPDGDGVVSNDCNNNGIPDECDQYDNIVEIARITPPTDASGIMFGTSLAIDDNVLVIGATSSSIPATQPGRVFIYRFDGDQWEPDGILTAPNMASELQFGYVVAIANGRIIVRQGPTDIDQHNSIHVFENNGATWELIQTIAMPGSFYFSRPALVAVQDHLYAFAAPPDGLHWYSWQNDEFVLIGKFGTEIADPETIVREALSVDSSSICLITAEDQSNPAPLGLIYDRNLPFVPPIATFNDSGFVRNSGVIEFYPPRVATVNDGVFLTCGSSSTYPNRVGFYRQVDDFSRREFEFTEFSPTHTDSSFILRGIRVECSAKP